MGSNAYNNAEEAIFAEMMQRMAAVEGQRAIEENERLKADPTFVVPDETHKKMMDLFEQKLCNQCFTSGRCTPIEDFLEDGLHPETEKVISEYLENKEFK